MRPDFAVFARYGEYLLGTRIEKRDHPKQPNYGIVTEHIEVLNQHNEWVMATQHLLLVEKKTHQAVS